MGCTLHPIHAYNYSKLKYMSSSPYTSSTFLPQVVEHVACVLDSLAELPGKSFRASSWPASWSASCIVVRHGAHILVSEGMQRSAHFMQHGNTSVREHSMRVACCAVKLSRWLRLELSERDLVHAALLHDYFLYDWHDRSTSRPHHATQHPHYAAENAIRDFAIAQEVEDAIRTHMFPVTLRIPRGSIAWMVCIADKLCSAQETVQGLWYSVGLR